ncbi:dephospho-CoA kinase [Leptospira wolffii]|uniref:Dephospho-CoA kinase n=1 Tax=Leptospira wolffii TaxID=409998 RepID=A0A2M9Z7R2_9LEPT|nr:dephospho-CoA kinase [Leptospira wolffii]PJZ64438.1 dephospho-CoA kinase [Leptospira wolffii]TGK54838.1 dephospho-CoA kinase [Leptospira wolffii]TGK65370.1 dephospho-CoA kinase [Leptospira wolffii]TGK70760.1 dephospho-CoA kinase [Leptospira wolffii]TGL26431.1 dephospho-CoA kinase [Leptospira wolffii]
MISSSRTDGAFLVGITGMIGGGKSTVAKILEELGGFRISADELARKYTDPDSPIRDELVEALGREILDESDKPDRKRIARLVFGNPEKLKALNETVHPRIRKEFLGILETQKKGTLVVWEVPLLFETDSYTLCDSTVCVLSDPETSLDRTVKRDGITREEAEARAKSQLSLQEKAKRAEYTVRNTGDLEDLRKECVELYAKLRGRIE